MLEVLHVGEKLKEKLFDLRCLNLSTGQNPKPCHRIHHVSPTSANNIMRTKTYKEDKKTPGYNIKRGNNIGNADLGTKEYREILKPKIKNQLSILRKNPIEKENTNPCAMNV